MTFATLLENGDVEGLRKIWAQAAPHLPPPKNFAEAEKTMHLARTQAESVSLRARAYSHRWLTERELPSALPDNMRQSAERMFPVTTEGVGISVNFRSEWMRGATEEVRGSMEDAVNEAYADKRTDPKFVKARMMEARKRTMRALFG